MTKAIPTQERAERRERERRERARRKEDAEHFYANIELHQKKIIRLLGIAIGGLIAVTALLVQLFATIAEMFPAIRTFLR